MSEIISLKKRVSIKPCAASPKKKGYTLPSDVDNGQKKSYAGSTNSDIVQSSGIMMDRKEFVARIQV